MEPTTTKKERRLFGHLFQKGDVWYLRYAVNGKRYYLGLKTRSYKEALKKALKRQMEVSDGITAPTPRRLAYEDLRALVLQDYDLRALRSKDRAEDAFKQLTAVFGGSRLVAITTPRLNAYVAARRGAGAQDGTIWKELRVLARGFHLAVEQKLIPSTQVPTFPKLKGDNPRTGFLGLAEFKLFHAELKALDSHVADLVEFLYITGWRTGEGLGLTWDRVDWEGKVVRLDAGMTKTGEARLFPFEGHPDLERLLRHRLEESDKAQLRSGKVVPLVFHRAGRPIKCFRTIWARVCHRTSHVGLVPHDLRRSAVRNFVRAGIPERVAMRLSGHKTRSVFDRYNIVDEEDLAQGVARLTYYVQQHTEEAVKA